MNAKELLTKIKQVFAEAQPQQPAQAVEPEKQKMAEYQLADGTVVEISELAVGGVVTIAGTPAPVGEHVLADGTKIEVVDNGVISEVEAAEAAPAQPSIEEMLSTKFAAFTNEIETKYAAKFADYEAKFEKQNKLIQHLVQLSELLAEHPTAQPDAAATKPNLFAKHQKNEVSIEKEHIKNLTNVLFNKK